MCGIGDGAEPPLVYLGIERGEEQVLQHGAVVGIAARPVIVFQQFANLLLDKQVLGDQVLLLDKPNEHQTGD